jgi:hypothetical protein
MRTHGTFFILAALSLPAAVLGQGESEVEDLFRLSPGLEPAQAALSTPSAAVAPEPVSVADETQLADMEKLVLVAAADSPGQPGMSADETAAIASPAPDVPEPPAAPAGSSSGEPPLPEVLSSTPTGSVVVNLINKLVDRGIISAEDAKTMVAQAQAEAETERAQNESDMFAIAQIAAVQTITSQDLAPQPGLSPLEASRQEMMASTGVTYIPAPVRAQLTEEIRRELGLGTVGGEQKPPPGLPTILAQLRPEGEIRFRYEADLYPENNDATGAFPNFNAINTGPPYNTGINNPDFAPQWNTDQNRNRYRILVRLGTGIELADNVSAGLRFATGENNSPTTANQSMGLANQAQGGQFSKYAIWLERAYLRYDLGGLSDEAGLTLWVGRFDNPFFSTPLIFDNELGFDGAAARLSYNYEDTLMPSLVAGAFPVFNTDLNFSSNQPEKFASYDKYLLAVQAGTKINLAKNWSTEVAAAYYDFYNIEGQLSSPYVPLSASDAGDTDNSRPSFAQKGNTYRPLRNIIPAPQNNFGTINQWQYYGLATPFRNFALTGRLDYDGFEPVRVSLVAEFVRNLAFNSSAINEIAVNNRGEIQPDNTDPEDIDTFETGQFEGDPNGWLVDLVVGHEKLDKLGAWQATFGYRWIGSDAVVDGFNDSEFGLGGSNMKGFTVGGRLALTPNVYVAARWFGSESIAGPQFDMNIFQVDIGVKF